MPYLHSIDIIYMYSTNYCSYKYQYALTCTNASAHITNAYTTYRYTNAIVSPSTQHTPITGGQNLSFSTLTIFVITYCILFPPPNNIPPPQGGEGELIFHTLCTPYTHALYTFSRHSIYILYTFYIFTVYTQYIVHVLFMHSSHALPKFYRHRLHVQYNLL